MTDCSLLSYTGLEARVREANLCACCEQVFVPDEMATSSVNFAASVLTISDALLYNSQAIEQVRALT